MSDDLTVVPNKEDIDYELEVFEERQNADNAPQPTATGTPAASKDNTDLSHSQWSILGNNKFLPIGPTVKKLVPGIYEPVMTQTGPALERLTVSSDGIYHLPDMATLDVLSEVEKFWSSEDRYRKHHLLYKRGIILHGPPGGGKTVTIKLLMNELVKKNGIVLVVHHINMATQVLKAMRRIEPARNLIIVMEDIDEIINYNGEAQVLSFLDGETNVDNVLYLATTNYPERLVGRIINRPSRFDRRVEIGMPGEEARKAYLNFATHEGLSVEDLGKWSEDTKGLSIAHLRELVAAVYCLEQPYDDVLKRLKDMQVMVKEEPQFRKTKTGF